MSRFLQRTLFLFVLILSLSSCNKNIDQPLRVGTNVWPGYEPLYLARELKQLKSEQVKLIEYASASEVIRAFRNRAIEAASLTLDEALGLVHDNYPLKIILIHDVSNKTDSILARNNIKTLKDIKGKTVAVESGALGAYVLSRSLELNGLKIQDVKIKHLDVNAHERAFLRNEVDVVVNFEPVRTRLLKQGAKEIFSSREMYGEIVDVLVVHEDTYQYHQQHLRHLVDSWFKALDYFEQNKQTAAGIMAKRLKVSPHEVISSFAGLELGSLSINQKLLSGNPPSLKATMKLLERVLQENGLVNSTLETSNLITDQFLR